MTDIMNEVDELVRSKGRRAKSLRLGEGSICASVCSIAKMDRYIYRAILAIDGIDSKLMENMHPVTSEKPMVVGEELFSDPDAVSVQYAAANYTDVCEESSAELIEALSGGPNRVHIKADNLGTRFQIKEISLCELV